MLTRERAFYVALILFMFSVAPLLISQKKAGRADVAMTAYVLDSMPLKYKSIDYFNVKSGGRICYRLGDLSDCFNPLIKSPQYTPTLDAVSGVLISKRNYWWVYYGDLLVEIPAENKNAHSREEVKNGLSYVISALQKELDKKEKIKETWNDSK
ncbi:hypothetical protein [Aeromonas hydrophila]